MKTFKNLALVFFILSTGVVFIPEKVNAQNELQFSQVLTYTGTLTSNQYSSTYTVPSNKVWKVETISIMSENNYVVNINNQDIYSYSYDDNLKFFPMWLKAGDTIKIKGGNGLGFFFSIIEYSVVAIQ